MEHEHIEKHKQFVRRWSNGRSDDDSVVADTDTDDDTGLKLRYWETE
jgi:hypothetical protein